MVIVADYCRVELLLALPDCLRIPNEFVLVMVSLCGMKETNLWLAQEGKIPTNFEKKHNFFCYRDHVTISDIS